MKVTITFQSGPLEMARLMKSLQIPDDIITIDATADERPMYEQAMNSPEVISANIIIELVVRHFLTSVEEVKSKSRERHVCEARFTAMRLIKEYMPGLALKQIGGFFGNRDHSSVIHSIETHKDLCKSDWNFAKKYNTIKKEVEKITHNVPQL